MSNAKIKEGEQYTVMVIRQGDSFCLGVMPRGEWVNVGTEVELESGFRGPVVLYDNYLGAETIELIERVAGIKAAPVKVKYLASKIEWNDDEEEDKNNG